MAPPLVAELFVMCESTTTTSPPVMYSAPPSLAPAVLFVHVHCVMVMSPDAYTQPPLPSAMLFY